MTTPRPTVGAGSPAMLFAKEVGPAGYRAQARSHMSRAERR